MKSAKEYYNLINNINIDGSKVLEIIKAIQIDAIQHTVKVCADEAEADFNFIGELLINDDVIEVYIIKESILSVADKLIKDIK